MTPEAQRLAQIARAYKAEESEQFQRVLEMAKPAKDWRLPKKKEKAS